jgi:putative ABC transport system permease protein
MNSLWRLQRLELGVEDADQILTFQLSLPQAQYAEESQVQSFFEELLVDLESAAGVEGVGFINRLPLLGGANLSTFSVLGQPGRAASFVSFRGITPGYFQAVGIRLKEGRWLDAGEFSQETTESILINERLANQLFGDEDPLGRTVGPEWKDGGMQVVGVVGDVLGGNPSEPAPPAFYYPLLSDVGRNVSVVMKSSGDVAALLPVLRGVVGRHDPDLPIFRVRTLGEIARGRMGTQRLANSVFALFAALALLLGAIGIYGVMSSSVAHRSRELGVRLALGASGGSVLRLVLSQGLRMTLPGLVIGLGLAWGAGRILEGLLFEVKPLDPLTVGVVSALLGLVSLAATCGPALRSMRIDPIDCIKEE